MGPPISLIPKNENESILHRNPFSMDDLVVPCKQEFMTHQISSSKSSPTALGLLLKSAMFQQLVQMSDNVPHETDKDQKTQYLQQQGADEVYQGILYEGTADGSFVGDYKPSIELQESTLYNERNEQVFWNGVISIQ